MKKRLYYIPILILILSIITLFRPAGRITFDKSVSANRILVKYEIFGCGSLVTKVLEGGYEITSKYKSNYPDVGTNEVMFTRDSDEPKNYYDAGEFFTGGIAEEFTYIVEGECMGVTKGAPECCSLKPAYNENVVQFKVAKWYYTSYVLRYVMADTNEFFIAYYAGILSIVSLALWGAIVMILKMYRKKRIKEK